MWPKTPFPARVSALMEQTDPAPDAPAARPQAPAPTVTVSTGRPFGSALARSQARAVSLLDDGGRGSSEGDKKYARRWTLGRTLRLAALVTFLAASGSVIALRWGRLPRKGAETRTTAARAVRGIQATQAADKVGFDAYFDAMNGNVDLYKQTEYPDTPTVLRAIRHHQMPRDCGKVRFLVFELWRHGIGSNQIGAATALALAIASNRVLLFATPAEGWLHSEGCNVDGAECFFQPISHCKLPANFNSLNVTAADQTLDYIPSSSARYILLRAGRPHMVPMRRNMPAIVRSARAKLRLPTLLPARKRAHLPLAYASVRAWHTQATLYLMRLNLHMQGLTRVGLARCSGLGGGRVGFLAAARTAGVPLRVTDKCRRPGAGEMRCVRAEEVADALAQVRSSHPWVDTVLVTSESREFAASVAHVLEGGWRVRRNPGDVQQGSGSAGKFGREAEGRRVAGYEVTRSILVTLACQAMPRYHVLTMKSNFHSLIDMMAKVVPGKTSHFSYNIGDVANPW